MISPQHHLPMDNNTQEQIWDLQTQLAALLQRVQELEDHDGGIANFETITCRELMVVDANDRPRIEAAVDEEDTANLFLRDQSGMQRIISSATATGDATVMWCDATGAARVTAGGELKFPSFCVPVPVKSTVADRAARSTWIETQSGLPLSMR